ncbi:hypothetical protein ACLB2K_034741 [Fragaria x ananassa]
MDPLNNYGQIPLIIILFFLFCFRYAEVECLPNGPYLTHPTASLWLRQLFPSTLKQPVASHQPQNSAPTADSPSPSSLSSSFFPPLLTGSSRTNPQRNLFMQSLQPTAAPSPPPAAVDPVVKQLCNNTNHSDLCISSLIPFLSAQGKTSLDAVTVLKMLIKACSIQAELALAVASKLSTEPKNAHQTAMAIMDCKDMYSDVLDGLQTATDAIAKKDMSTVKSMLTGVISDAVTCEDGFAGQKSPLGDFDDKLHNRELHSHALPKTSPNFPKPLSPALTSATLFTHLVTLAPSTSRLHSPSPASSRSNAVFLMTCIGLHPFVY